MSPTLHDGELVVIDTCISPRVGDLALIDTELGSTLHRVLKLDLSFQTDFSTQTRTQISSQRSSSKISFICAGDRGQRIDLVNNIQGVAVYQMLSRTMRDSEIKRADNSLKPLRHSGWLYRIHQGIAKLAYMELRLSDRSLRSARALRFLSKSLRKLLINSVERYVHHISARSVS